MDRSFLAFLLVIIGSAIGGYAQSDADYLRFCRMVDSECIKGHRIINVNIDADKSDEVITLDSIPVYIFKKNKVGNFIRELCDTTAKYDNNSCKLLEPLSYDSINGASIKEAYSLKQMTRKIGGIVYLHGNPKYFQILFLVNPNTEWIDRMSLEKTNETVSLRFRTCDGIMMEPEFCFQAQIMVTPSGKVNIPAFFYGGKSLAEYSDSGNAPDFITAINDWIRQYYIEHHFTLRQEYLDE